MAENLAPARPREEGQTPTARDIRTAAGLSFDELLAVDWQAVLADESLSARELAALAAHKAPLVQFRGQWVAVAAGDKALVFTQFKEMGDKLVARFTANLDGEVLFLHGATPKRARDQMVQRFQEEPRGPRMFVLSVKAGGTGLNLTAASHVFHYDRWWNPAVEDQATDRAHRIGRRAVQVHKLVCAGTVEDKIDRLLEHKRELAAKVVGAGEQWITELGGAELRELFALAGDGVAEADDEEPPSAGRAPRRRATRKSSEARS